METNEATRRPQTFRKEERLCRQLLIDRLFAGGSKSMSAFPMRLVYLPVEASEANAPVTLLISVPKKRFRRAVKRNRVKRQIREAYRLNKQILLHALPADGSIRLAVAFIYLADKLMETAVLEERMKGALARIAETVAPAATSSPDVRP